MTYAIVFCVFVWAGIFGFLATMSWQDIGLAFIGAMIIAKALRLMEYRR